MTMAKGEAAGGCLLVVIVAALTIGFSAAFYGWIIMVVCGALHWHINGQLPGFGISFLLGLAATAVTGLLRRIFQ
jgi:hypothetical protein